MTLPGRGHPDLPPDMMFTILAIRALKAYAAQRDMAAPDNPVKRGYPATGQRTMMPMTKTAATAIPKVQRV